MTTPFSPTELRDMVENQNLAFWKAKSKVEALYKRKVLSVDHPSFLPQRLDSEAPEGEPPNQRSHMDPEEFFAYYATACAECGITFAGEEAPAAAPPAAAPAPTPKAKAKAPVPKAKASTPKAAPAPKAATTVAHPASATINLDEVFAQLTATEERIVAAVANAAPSDFDKIVNDAMGRHIGPMNESMQSRFNESELNQARIMGGQATMIEAITGDPDAVGALQSLSTMSIEELIAEGVRNPDPT